MPPATAAFSSYMCPETKGCVPGVPCVENTVWKPCACREPRPSHTLGKSSPTELPTSPQSSLPFSALPSLSLFFFFEIGSHHEVLVGLKLALNS